MTAMTVYADSVTEGDILDSGAVVLDIVEYPSDVDFVDLIVNRDGAVEIVGFAYDDLLPILRAVDF